MKKFVLFFLVVASWCNLRQALAQTKEVAADGFVRQNNSIVLLVGTHSRKAPQAQQEVALSKDVVLSNGTKINYLGGIVEYADGRQVELKEGDFVAMNGDVKVAGSGEVIVAEVPVSAAFTHKPALPLHGRLKGVVELGASGFNSFVVRMDEERRWKLEKSEFGNSLVMENLATEDDVRRGLKAYIGQMLDYGVGPRDIHFVVSSGASKAENTAKIVQSLKGLNYVVNVVTPAEEGTMAMRAMQPRSYSHNSFVVDMGSANTKVAWLEGGKSGAAETHGSKYFQQNLSDSLVAADVRQKLQQVPAARRATCFIIGGVPYELAKAIRQGQERYTQLAPAASYTQQTTAKMKAGVTIYQAIAEATGCQQFVFDYEANFTIGYLLGLPY
jgi:hypothetical protein